MINRSHPSGTAPLPLASLPPTSLIIASRNRPQLLKDAVESILNGNELPEEIVIIDQSDFIHPALSDMKTTRGCGIRYLWTQSVGLSRANNIGIAAARYDLLIFTHDDVLVAPTWFEMIVKAALGVGPRSVVTGQVRPTTARMPGDFASTTKVDEAPSTYSGRLDADILYPLNMAMHRVAFTEVGSFDERLGPGTPFPAAEDNDLGFRLLEAGYQIHYVPDAVIYHRAWRTAQDYMPMRWNYGFGQGAFYAKYFKFNDRFMYGRMWEDLARHGSRLLQSGWKRSFRRNYSDVVYILGLVCGAAKWLLTQRKIN